MDGLIDLNAALVGMNAALGGHWHIGQVVRIVLYCGLFFIVLPRCVALMPNDSWFGFKLRGACILYIVAIEMTVRL